MMRLLGMREMSRCLLVGVCVCVCVCVCSTDVMRVDGWMDGWMDNEYVTE
jgi:hypothetical protein